MSEKVSVILSDVALFLAKTKSGEVKRLSEQLLELRARVKAVLTWTVPTQQLALWRAYGSLSDVWIYGIGVAAVKETGALRKECSEKEAKIEELRNDVYVLCTTKYSELSESRESEWSFSRRLPLLRPPSLRRLESRQSTPENDSITTFHSRFVDTEKAVMAPAIGSTDDKVVVFQSADVRSRDESTVFHCDLAVLEPSVSSVFSPSARVSLSTDSVLRLHATKPMAEPSTDSGMHKEEGDDCGKVLLGNDSRSKTTLMETQSFSLLLSNLRKAGLGLATSRRRTATVMKAEGVGREPMAEGLKETRTSKNLSQQRTAGRQPYDWPLSAWH